MAFASGNMRRWYTRGRVPPFISQLTGITQAEVDRFGIPVRQAFSSFLDFVEDLPVFFHNASFDRRFLAAASDQTGLAFANPVHCTLALARRAWPELPSHKLDILARHVGASDPTHRAPGRCAYDRGGGAGRRGQAGAGLMPAR